MSSVGGDVDVSSGDVDVSSGTGIDGVKGVLSLGGPDV